MDPKVGEGPMAVFLALVGRSQGVATTTYPSKKRQTRPAELAPMMPHEPLLPLKFSSDFPKIDLLCYADPDVVFLAHCVFLRTGRNWVLA